MPPKADPRDWDRYFRPGAPRRGGPLRALANLLLLCTALGLVSGAAYFTLSFGLDRARQSAEANARLIQTSDAAVIGTRTARALSATATGAAQAATSASTPTAAAAQPIGRGSVRNGGNLRSEPRVADETVIGQICAGDQIDFLERRSLADGALWYRIRLTVAAANCTAQRVTVGSAGWASATLLSEPAP
jgi:hypothetical protein